MFRVLVRSIAAFLMMGCAAAAAAQAPQPVPSAPMAPGRPGTLISAQPVASQVAGSRAWRIAYWTRGIADRMTRATGLVIAPNTAGTNRPILAWTHGTWGIADDCAPSRGPQFWNQSPGLGALSQNMVVVAPDYVGLGDEDGPHPFLIGPPNAHSVLDAVRAVASLQDARAGRTFALWGESQGGHAALWTASAAPSYAPDLRLVGTVAAAPPTALVDNLRQAPEPTVRTFFTTYITKSWSDSFGIPLASVGGPVTQNLIDRMSQQCITLGSKPSIATIAGLAILQANLRNVDLGALQPWAGIAASNSAPTTGFTAPLMIAQNMGDQLVAPAVTVAYAKRLCAAGRPLSWVSVKGEGHATTAKDSAAVSLSWIADRLAGRPAPNDCSSVGVS